MSEMRFRITADSEGLEREVEKSKRSLASLPPAARTAQAGFDGMGMSAAQTAAAMRQVPMQVTDIVTSLASGQPAFMVAIQQGGQLKDMFGGIVPAAKALSSTVLGMVNPLTLAGTAAAAVGVAWYQSEQQAAAFSKALILSGNAIGMTTGQLQQMAATQGLAASALAEMAGSSSIASRDLAQFTGVAVEWERATGQAVSETRKQFESLAESPVDALLKLNEGTNFLTVAVLDQVAALKDQGKETEAAEVAQRAWASALERRAADVQESTNKMVRAWSLVVSEARSAWAAMVRQFDDETPAEQLEKLDQQIAAIEGRIKNRQNRTGGLLGQWLGDDPAQLAGLKAQRDAMAETIRLSERAQLVAAERAAAERKAVEERAAALRKEEEEARKAERAAEAAARARVRSLEEEKRAREQLDEVIRKALERDDERQAKDDAASAEEALKAWEAEAAARAASAAAADKQVLAFAGSISAIQFETELLRMSSAEREFAIEMRKLEALGVEKGTEAWDAYANALRGAIDARAGVKAGIEAAAEYQREFERINDQIGQSLSDALMDGGRSAADYLRGLFRQLVLRPVFSPIAAAVSGAFMPGSAAASGGGSSALGAVGQLAGLSGAFGTGLASSFSSMASAGIGGWASAAGSLMGTTGSMAGVMAGAGMVAAPLAAAYALYSLLSSGGEKRAGSTYGYSASDLQYGQGLNGIWSDDVAGMISGGSTRFIGGPSGGDIGGETIRASVAATVEGINGLFERLGSTEKIDQFWGKLEQSEKGRGGVFAGGRLASGASFGEAAWEAGTSRTLTADEAIAAFALDLQQATIQALQAATDIPAAVADVVRGIDAEALSQEQVGALLQTVEAIVAVTAALGTLGVQAESVTTAMIEAAGGAESLQTAAAAYYQGYYSEAERVGRVSEQLAGQFADLGLEMPATRDEFRSLVESLDLTSASGQAAYGALLPLSDAFGAVADFSARAAEEAARAAEEMARATEETARAAEMARLDAQAQATWAEIDALIDQFGDLAGAMRELEAPAETLVDAWRRTASELQSLEQGLAAALGGTQMSSLDQLRATTAGIAGLGMAIADLDAQMLAVRVGRGDAGAVSALRAEEARLMQELAVSGDPAATAAALARVTLQRIDLEARRRADADAEALSAAQEIAALEGESRAAQIDALRDQISAAERLRGISESLVSLSADLRSGSLSALDPFGRQDAMAAEYQRVLGMARAGDVDAARAFGSLARDYLSSGQSLYGGATAQYADLFRTVLQDVDALGASLDRPGDVAAQQLEALLAIDAQQEQARQITLDTSGQQLDALAGIREALIGRQDELRAQQAEQAGALREQVAALRQLVEGQEAEIRQRAEAMAQLNARLDTLIAAQDGQARAAELEAASA
jgi:hypothetical protein